MTMAKKPLRKRLTRKAIPKEAHFATKVGTGKSLFLLSDGRSLYARRLREIAQSIAGDLGGGEQLTELQKQLTRRAAALSLSCELAEGDLVDGKEVDIGKFTSAANTLTRISSVLGVKRVSIDVTPSLADFIAKKRAEKARKPPEGDDDDGGDDDTEE